MSNSGLVTAAICCQDSVAILQVGTIVTHLVAEKISKSTACFFEDDLRRAGIPKLGTRTWVNVDIASLFGDEPDL